MHAASVHARWDVVSVLPFPSSAGPATQLAAFSPRAAFQARVQLDPGAVTFWIGVQQNVRSRRLLLHQLLAVQGRAAGRHGRQTRHVVLRGRKGGVLTGRQTAASTGHHRFARTRRVMVAVAVTMSRRVAIHVYFGSRWSGPVGAGAAVSTPSRTTAAPAVPNIIAFSAVMDEDEEAQGDREGTVQAAEDHVQEGALRHSQRPKGPGGQEEEQGEGRRSQLSLERVLIGQQRGVDGDARAASRAVAPAGRRPGFGPLVTVGRHVHGSQSLLLLRQLLQLVLFLGVFSQLDEGAEEVDAGYQDNERDGAEERPQAGLPGHPATETRTGNQNEHK